MGRIRVGTASWTDKTLIASGWYPEGVESAAERLGYYASQFDLVEVDSTYYSPPAENTAALWASRTPAGFTFNVKAFSLLTQHPTRPASLYKDLRPSSSSTKNLYLHDLDDSVVDEVWERFLAALQPLRDAGKLGALLFQFPQWFPIGRRNREYILQVRERCGADRICVEFRNKTWLSSENQESTLGFLTDYQVPYVVVDMPQGHASSVPPIVAATADLAVVRFHGHSDKWTSKDIHEKFGYLYSEKEMEEWAPKIRDLPAKETHVLMNNCYSDYAQRNAAQLVDLLA
ncbi:DUF72 domain-containing protein [Cryptosporangium phraense]|uniref:DUF72 domain-containing protein n=1 Tax=Cryptosporangium phraense TaxID=2593070 RepID=A0A545AYM0_9ACTN|nr:DUF72 domain-containing protein [Cryptosporangium phraense]TQS46411.1 DUF72 domain-containing protein [Cryptosporangium phraense]